MNATSKSLFARLKPILVPLGILATGVGGFLVFGQKPEVPQRQRTDNSVPLVETSQVSRFTEPLEIEVDGVAVPHRQVTLSAEVAGRITRKNDKCRAGRYVHKGDFLLQIDPTDYELEVARLESELKQADEDIKAVEVDIKNAEALIRLAREDLDLRRKELLRTRSLFSSNALSESNYDEARRLELASRNALQTLENQLAAHRQRKLTLAAARNRVTVQLNRAKADLRRAKVEAPIDGTVVSDFVEEGDYVRRGDRLVLLNESSCMEIKCSLRLDQLYWLWLSDARSPGTRANPQQRFELPKCKAEVVFRYSGAEYVWDGELARYEGTGVDEKTRLVPCRVRVDQPTHARAVTQAAAVSADAVPVLLSGMFVTVRIPVNPPVPFLAVPDVALRPGGVVWVVRDGRLHFEAVEVVMTQDGQVVVRPGKGSQLQPGDKVITSPLPNVRKGMAVKEAAS